MSISFWLGSSSIESAEALYLLLKQAKPKSISYLNKNMTLDCVSPFANFAKVCAHCLNYSLVLILTCTITLIVSPPPPPP